MYANYQAPYAPSFVSVLPLHRPDHCTPFKPSINIIRPQRGRGRGRASKKLTCMDELGFCTNFQQVELIPQVGNPCTTTALPTFTFTSTSITSLIISLQKFLIESRSSGNAENASMQQSVTERGKRVSTLSSAPQCLSPLRDLPNLSWYCHSFPAYFSYCM